MTTANDDDDNDFAFRFAPAWNVSIGICWQTCCICMWYRYDATRVHMHTDMDGEWRKEYRFYIRLRFERLALIALCFIAEKHGTTCEGYWGIFTFYFSIFRRYQANLFFCQHPVFSHANAAERWQCTFIHCEKYMRIVMKNNEEFTTFCHVFWFSFLNFPATILYKYMKDVFTHKKNRTKVHTKKSLKGRRMHIENECVALHV